MHGLVEFPDDAKGAPGALVLIGGHETQESFFKEMLDLNGAKSVAIITTASSIPRETVARYLPLFNSLAPDVREIFIEERKDADDEAYVRMLTGCDLYFFTGGDQEKLVRIFEGSRSLEVIRRRHGEGATVAGTSAGASALAPWIIYDVDDCQGGRGLTKGSFSVSKGFDFFSPLGMRMSLVVDTHFLERGRQSRVAQLFAAGEIRRAIGISENTCATITGDGKMHISGQGAVVALNGEQVYASTHSEIEENELITVGAVAHDYLSANASFDLNTWRIDA